MNDSKGSQKYYDKSYYLENVDGHDLWECFDGTPSMLHPRFKRNFDLLNLRSDESLLDVGCGRGEICIAHALRGGKATGIDYSTDAINLAMKKQGELKIEANFVCSSFEIMESIQPESLDVVYASEFIEHISIDEAKVFVRLAHQVLKVGGRIMIHTYPNTIQRRYGYPISRLIARMKGRTLPKVQTDMLTEHYLKYHLNEQNLFGLSKLVRRYFNIQWQGYDDAADGTKGVAQLVKNSPIGHLFRRDMVVIGRKI